MTPAGAQAFQVAVTGTRLTPHRDEELNRTLQARFRLTPAQSAAMLKGRCVVKRDIDAPTAQKLVAVLREVGLVAIIEQSSPVVAPAPASRPTAKPVLRKGVAPKVSVEALAALQGLANQRLQTPRSSLPYLAGLLLVTLLCVALPATYIGLAGGIAYGWVWYLTHIHHYLPRSVHLVALMYAVPALAGAMLVLFLVRPLFVPRPRPRETLTLDAEKEAGFVAGVHALCRAIGVVPPVEIRLSWDANASVQFQTRWLSLFTGHKVLTIGLSMVAGLTARQLVGVLAHEFGHFAQRFGMICSFTVNSVNAWLEHRAYGEDAWDRKLRDWSEAQTEKDHWFSWLVNISIMVSWLAIALTRRLMRGLFQISLRLSQYMSRQMEFDADRYEALVAGSDMFRITARSLRALNHAFAEVNQANIEAWQEHRLLRDLPEAVAAHARDFDTRRLKGIEEEMRAQTVTRFWDSHPPDGDRIENAEKRRSPGIYLQETPARLLFRDFSGWAQRATRLFYAENEVEFAEEQLRSREEIMGHVQHRSRQREQLNRFCNGQFQDWPLLRLKPPAPNGEEPPGWQDCIDGIRARSPEIAREWLQALQAHERRPLLHAAVKLGVGSRDFGLPGPDRSADQLRDELAGIAAGRLPFNAPLEEAFGLYALRIEHAIGSMSAANRDRATKLHDTLAGLCALEREAALLEELSGAMRALSALAESNGEMPHGVAELEANFGDSASKLLARADRIAQKVTEGGTVGGYLRSRCRGLPAEGEDTREALARACWPLPGAFHHFYLLTLGELVSLCEAAEKGCGIRPIRLVA